MLESTRQITDKTMQTHHSKTPVLQPPICSSVLEFAPLPSEFSQHLSAAKNVRHVLQQGLHNNRVPKRLTTGWRPSLIPSTPSVFRTGSTIDLRHPHRAECFASSPRRATCAFRAAGSLQLSRGLQTDKPLGRVAVGIQVRQIDWSEKPII